MSDIHIGIVAEGATDFIIIQAILEACLPSMEFIPHQLQPENNYPKHGNGWGGVCKWADDVSQRQFSSLDEYLEELGYPAKVIIIHLDMDVLCSKYSDANLNPKPYWLTLPNKPTCPPISDSNAILISTLESWLSPTLIGNQTVLCLPAQAIETWLAAAIFGTTILYTPPESISECSSINLEKNRPKPLKVPKTITVYKEKAPLIIQNWQQVTQICSQARLFEQEILRVLP